MTEQSGQSQTYDWYDAETALAADELGPYRLVVSAPDTYLGEDGYTVVPSGKAQLVVTNSETGETLLDQEVTPVFGQEEGFTTFDHDQWKVTAERAIADSGVDLDALFASLRDDAA